LRLRSASLSPYTTLFRSCASTVRTRWGWRGPDGRFVSSFVVRWQADLDQIDRVAAQMQSRGYSAREIAEWRQTARDRALGRFFRDRKSTRLNSSHQIISY